MNLKSEYCDIGKGQYLLDKKIYMNWSVIFINKKIKNEIYNVPIWEKANLTLEETAVYSGIGINKLRDISNGEDCPFVLWVGNKRLIKRKVFDSYIEKQYSI